jgi:hypothetical protein
MSGMDIIGKELKEMNQKLHSGPLDTMYLTDFIAII